MITAHRGNSIKAPENTLSALEYAIKDGADYSEIDVRETKDGIVVLSHDNNLNRFTGEKKYISEISYDELKTYDVGSWFNKGFNQDRVPTLEEAINRVRGKMKLNIEIKTDRYKIDLPQKVVSIIEKERFIDDCIITCMDYNVLKEIKKLNSSIKIGYITCKPTKNNFKLNVDFYCIKGTNVSKMFIGKCHLVGREVHVWGINNKEQMEKMIDFGVDNIITDSPYMLKKVLNQNNKGTY